MNSPLTRNALANVLQTLASAGLLFALYRYINATLGVALLGVWSVVLAAVSASRLADLGLSAGVTRFVARDLARGDPDRAAQVIDTAALTLMASVGAVAPLLDPLIAKLLPHLFQGAHLPQALEILPYALASLWLTIVAAVFQGGLDGCQRMDLRAGLVVSGQALLLALALWLVPQLGLVGLAWAQMGQGLFLAIGGRLLLRCALPEISPLPHRWRLPMLREMLCYGMTLQAAAVFMLLLDPIAKALMARVGGAAAAGYFEMANQVALKIRSVIVAANQAIVPRVAELAEIAPVQLARVYRANMSLLLIVTAPTFALAFAWAGGVSWLLLGQYRPEFVSVFGILLLPWGFNIFAGPAYFSNMGMGQVGWNAISHLVMGTVNLVLGWLLGSRFGADGVVFAYAVAVVTGSGILIAIFQQKNGLGWHDSVAPEHFWLIAACIAVAGFGLLYPVGPDSSLVSLITVRVLVPVVFIGVAAWRHPLRREIYRWFKFRRAAL